LRCEKKWTLVFWPITPIATWKLPWLSILHLNAGFSICTILPKLELEFDNFFSVTVLYVNTLLVFEKIHILVHIHACNGRIHDFTRETQCHRDKVVVIGEARHWHEGWGVVHQIHMSFLYVAFLARHTLHLDVIKARVYN
jgi:hypothetical protein